MNHDSSPGASSSKARRGQTSGGSRGPNRAGRPTVVEGVLVHAEMIGEIPGRGHRAVEAGQRACSPSMRRTAIRTASGQECCRRRAKATGRPAAAGRGQEVVNCRVGGAHREGPDLVEGAVVVQRVPGTAVGTGDDALGVTAAARFGVDVPLLVAGPCARGTGCAATVLVVAERCARRWYPGIGRLRPLAGVDEDSVRTTRSGAPCTATWPPCPPWPP